MITLRGLGLGLVLLVPVLLFGGMLSRMSSAGLPFVHRREVYFLYA